MLTWPFPAEYVCYTEKASVEEKIINLKKKQDGAIT